MGKSRAAGKNGLLAIVIAQDPFVEELARGFAAAVEGHQQGTRIFHGLNEALQWLGYGDTEADKRIRFMRAQRIVAIAPAIAGERGYLTLLLAC